MTKAFLLVIAITLILPNFFNKDISPTPPYNRIENFDPGLAYINTPGKLEKRVDSIAAEKNIPTKSFDYVLIAEGVLKDRFYHGFSHFSLAENWIAAVSGYVAEEGMACKVKQEDILLHANAACSQQSIVLMELLHKKNIYCRKIGFPHHYAIEAMIDKTWYFFDADMEPLITREQRMEKNWRPHPDVLKQYYDTRRFGDLDARFGINMTAVAGAINEDPAPNVKVFHSITGVLSKTLWCLPLLMLFRRRFSFSPSFSFGTKRKSTPVSLAA
jgi:hypothetical protein